MSDNVQDIVLEVQGENSTVERLVQKIIDTDSVAQQLISDAKSARNNTAKTVAQRKKELYDSYVARSQEEVDRAAAQARADADKELAEQAQRFESTAKELESKFEKNHDKWLDEIINGVTAI